MPEKINYGKIPEHCRAGMKAYIENGQPVGNFLTAVLENNLVQSFGLADDVNIERIRDYANFLYWEAPSPCWGSPEKVVAWIEQKAKERSTHKNQ